MTIKELVHLLNSELESDRQIGYAILESLKKSYEQQKGVNNETE